MRKRIGFSDFLPMLICGLAMTAAAIYLFVNTADFSKNGVKGEAVITNIESYYRGDDYEHDVYVKFTVDGKEYSGQLNVYESGFRVGKTVPIIYKPDNPQSFIYGKRNTFIAVLLSAAGLFVLFLALKAPAFALGYKISLAIKKRGGREVEATITRVERSLKNGLLFQGAATVSFIASDGSIYEKRFVFLDDERAVEGAKVSLYVDYYNSDRFAVDFKGVG